MINLLSNAVKYTPEGGNIWFRIIGLKQRSEQYEHIRIEVEDDGYGMTQEYLKTIFDAFTRAENSTTNKVQGTGFVVPFLNRTDCFLRIEECVHRNPLIFHKRLDVFVALFIAVHQQNSGNPVFLPKLHIRLLFRYPAFQFNPKKASFIHLAGNVYRSSHHAIEVAEKIRKVLQDTVPVIFLTVSDINEIEEVCRVENTGVFVKPFFVSIFKEKVLEVQKGQREEEVLEKVESGNLEGMRFLAAEDNEINAEILLEILSIEGASCEITGNGQLALERFYSLLIVYCVSTFFNSSISIGFAKWTFMPALKKRF